MTIKSVNRKARLCKIAYKVLITQRTLQAQLPFLFFLKCLKNKNYFIRVQETKNKRAMFPLIFCSRCAQKFLLCAHFFWYITMCSCSKFMRVRSLWKLCARAHAHSWEGTLHESLAYFLIFLAFRLTLHHTYCHHSFCIDLDAIIQIQYDPVNGRCSTKRIKILLYMRKKSWETRRRKQTSKVWMSDWLAEIFCNFTIKEKF